MTLDAETLAAMGERHRADFDNRVPGKRPLCEWCGGEWPCDSRRLLDEVEACHQEIAGLKALFMPEDAR